MDVIALRGKPNTGKTTTIKHLIKDILSPCGDREKGELLYCRYKRPMLDRVLDPNDEKWFTSMEKKNVQNVTVLVKYKGKYIAITTLGDGKDLIIGAYNSAKKNLESKYGIRQIDIYICACHPRMDVEKMFGCKTKYVDKNDFPDAEKNDSYFKSLLFDEMEGSL